MTCEDDTPELTWEISYLEPHSRVWVCKAYGRTTATVAPADIARAALSGYLAGHHSRGETFRATARTPAGDTATINAADLPDGSWQTAPAVRDALPSYLQDALPG